MSENDEVARFGEAVEDGESPEIERGGTLARDRSGDGRERKPDDVPRDDRRRRPPRGRTHGVL